MEPVIYRNVRKEDYAQIEELINQSFGLHGYVSSSKVLKYIKKQYLYSCLAEATYTCVAVKGERVVGVIMGNAKEEYSVFSHLPFLIKMCCFQLLLCLCLPFEGKIIRDYGRLHEIYQNFSARHKGEFDGVVTLFAVEKECRGTGVGKTLLNRLMRYLKKRNVKKIYLYTDTTCNYGFYEHQGFKRMEQQSMMLKRNGEVVDMDVFLYGFNMSLFLDC